ncbi:low temperature requirement protein A [Herbiconiux flava]|uniref:Low temperature requirement protein LtrA n=1 Tax=Herbiconiux flava TaxID=881268 RepID=A0A852SQ75_9MICO|nr:low temperature requirement protein A [Herbiconiux flava]NYD70956.1 low temperature requirement protein LtrA [Herbiconiux flava]GLK19082.1 membrane protein [Herbiconiux flava]
MGDDGEFRERLREDLLHRLRPLRGQRAGGPGRSATPLELLYDLTYVIAFAAAAEQLAHQIGEGHVGPAIGAYVFAIWAISWAWMNFSWFSSAYGNDDALFRILTIVQMVGAIVLVFGLPVSFERAVTGESPNNLLMVVGYIVMRVPLIVLWLRAARADARHRRIDVAYALAIGVAQTLWLLTAVLPLPAGATVGAIVVLALAEMVAPVVLEHRYGRAPWNAGHIAERFSLLTLIALGEVIAATVTAVGALTGEKGWSIEAVVLASSGLVLAAGFWWSYFLIPSGTVLERWPSRVFAWRYAHLPIFGAIAAVGAGLRIAAEAIETERLTVLQITLALVVPVAVMTAMIFITWSALMRSFDATHLPLFGAALVPLAAALAVAVSAGREPVDLASPGSLTALLSAIVLVALCPVVEVVGHELVGYRHTLRVVDRTAVRADAVEAASR